MSCIVYQTDKKTGTKFAYKSVSYWDKEKKQPRSKREYLGKVDPVTGEIITSKKKAVTASSPDVDDAVNKLSLKLAEKEKLIDSQNEEILLLNKKIAQLEKTLTKISALIATVTENED